MNIKWLWSGRPWKGLLLMLLVILVSVSLFRLQSSVGLFVSWPGLGLPDNALPTPDPRASTVVGKLLLTPDNKPLAGTVVFLERSTPDDIVPPVLYAPPNAQPHAVSNDTGDFVISQVPDDEYVVILFLPPADIHVLTRPNTDQPLVISARAGKVINLGVVSVSK